VDAEEIRDDDWLLRRIPPWHLPEKNQNEPDGSNQTIRPPSAAFALDRGETGLSFHLESSLRAAGEPLSCGCPDGEPGWAVTRISVSTVRAMGHEVVRDDQPHHVLLLGLADLKGTALKRAQREIARKSSYVILPLVG
jgi:hypothetical protein